MVPRVLHYVGLLLLLTLASTFPWWAAANAVRAEYRRLLSALACVDYVVLFAEKTPERLIRRIRPDVLVKGGDYASTRDVVGGRFVESNGGRVELAPLVKGVSTSDLLRRLGRGR